MRALVYAGPESVELREVAAPSLEAEGDAIVRTRLAGICGSDLHVYHGREKGLDPGTIMGHELVGEVVETGPGVEGLAVGDIVCSPFTTSCGDCFYCRRGLTSRCPSGQLLGWVEKGAGLQGAQAEYVRIPMAASTLLRLPPGITEEQGLLLGDVLATGYYGAERAGLGPDDVAVVLGCGPVGLMAVGAAIHLGVGRLFAVDAVPERLALAAALGAEPLSLDGGPLAAVLDATGGRGADAVLEAVGGADASRLAFELVRPGGAISAVGVHTGSALGFTPAEAYDRNLTFRVGRCPARHYMDRLVPFLRAHGDRLTGIVSHRLPLEEGPSAYRLFSGRREGCVKVVLRP